MLLAMRGHHSLRFSAVDASPRAPNSRQGSRITNASWLMHRRESVERIPCGNNGLVVDRVAAAQSDGIACTQSQGTSFKCRNPVQRALVVSTTNSV